MYIVVYNVLTNRIRALKSTVGYISTASTSVDPIKLSKRVKAVGNASQQPDYAELTPTRNIPDQKLLS